MVLVRKDKVRKWERGEEDCQIINTASLLIFKKGEEKHIKCVKQQYQQVECLLMSSLYYFNMDWTDMSREWLNRIMSEQSQASPNLTKLFKSLCE